MADKPRACPRCHRINRGAQFCDQCGRGQPRAGRRASLRLLRFAVAVMLVLIVVGGCVAFGFSLWVMTDDLLEGALTLLKGAAFLFVAVVQREVLRVVIEIRERV